MRITFSLFLFLSLFLSKNVLAQGTMILPDQKIILSTNVWSFYSQTYSYSGIVNVQIGNNGKGGTLLLQVKSSNPTFYIGGTVYLILEDGTVITCTDKNLRKTEGQMIMSYYTLTFNEINALKKTKLTDVRFKINGTEKPFSSPIGYFTAFNKIKSFGFDDKSFDTVTEINSLFK